jgi:D-3-phosphoglycerate dehydrogenase
VVNTADLVKMLQAGKIVGAGLDVLEKEDPAAMNGEEKKWFGFLQHAQQVVLTPHIGGWTTQSFRKISEVLLRKIEGLKI